MNREEALMSMSRQKDTKEKAPGASFFMFDHVIDNVTCHFQPVDC